MAQAAPRFAQVTGSAVAATATPLRDRMNRVKEGGLKWTAVTLALACVPVIGVALAYGVDRIKNHSTAHKQQEVLAEYYADQVAATLGIPAGKVTVRELEAAARYNPMLAQAIAKVEQEKDSSNRAAAFGMAGAYATGHALAPVLGGITSGVIQGATKLVADGAGNVAGSAISTVFDKKVLHVHDVMEIIDARQKAGEPVKPQDVMMLRIAQDGNLQKAIKKHSDVAFHKMNEAQQQQVIAGLPGAYWAEALESANKVNAGQKTAQQLLEPAHYAASDANYDPNSWANRVQRQSRPSESWTASIEQQRVQGAAGVMQRS